MDIKENIQRIAATLPAGVQLIAVSKTKPAEAIEEAYVWGEKNVKYIAPFVRLIHSVDSLKLLMKIDREAAKCCRTIDCLLEFHIAEETTKSGLTYEQAVGIVESEEYRELKNVRIAGVMGIATYTEDAEQVRREFRQLKQMFDRLKELYFTGKPEFKEISMGMSGDYRIAVEEGCTMVRIGSSIFGRREYMNTK